MLSRWHSGGQGAVLSHQSVVLKQVLLHPTNLWSYGLVTTQLWVSRTASGSTAVTIHVRSGSASHVINMKYEVRLRRNVDRP
jgi:hypothetical protein